MKRVSGEKSSLCSAMALLGACVFVTDEEDGAPRDGADADEVCDDALLAPRFCGRPKLRRSSSSEAAEAGVDGDAEETSEEEDRASDATLR
jgi:hypothetical protein